MLAIAANVIVLPSLQRGNPADPVPYEAMRRCGTVRSAYASATGRRWSAKL